MTTLVENDDEASSFIDPSAENLLSPGLSEQAQPPVPYAASPTRSLFNHEEECNLLFDMAGGMMMSDEGLVSLERNLMINTPRETMMSPPKTHFSLPSDDSIGNSGPTRLWSFADHSPVLGQNQTQSHGIWPAALEPESRGKRSDYSVNIDEWFNMPTQYRLWDDGGEYSVVHELHNMEKIMKVALSLIAVDSELFSHKELSLNIAVQSKEKGAYTDVNVFWKCKYTTISIVEVEVVIRGALIEQNSVTHQPRSGQCGVRGRAVFEWQLDSPCEGQIPKSSAKNDVVVVGLKRIDAIVNSLKKKDIIWWEKVHGITLQVLEQLFVSPSTFKPARRDFSITRGSLEEVGTADIWPALLQQEDSFIEGRIPKSSATNEERNVVELKSIDPKGNNSSEKTDTISRWEKDHGITRHVLEQLFGKSRHDAAKTLKVSTSTLKRACRDFGINRWPNHSKGKRPICSLNKKQAVKKHTRIQPCPALPPLQATSTSQCYSTMSVKVTYQNDIIRFPLSSSSTMKYLEEQLETKFKISLQNLSIKYQDEEDEWITLTCHSELMHGMDVLRSCGKTVIKIMVTPKFD